MAQSLFWPSTSTLFYAQKNHGVACTPPLHFCMPKKILLAHLIGGYGLTSKCCSDTSRVCSPFKSYGSISVLAHQPSHFLYAKKILLAHLKGGCGLTSKCCSDTSRVCSPFKSYGPISVLAFNLYTFLCSKKSWGCLYTSLTLLYAKKNIIGPSDRWVWVDFKML